MAGGIGAAIAAAFAEAGAPVVIADVATAARNSVTTNIVQRGGKAIACELDSCNENAVETAFVHILRQLGRVDVLVNSAGIARRAPAVDQMLTEWDRVIAVPQTLLVAADEVIE